MHTKLWWARQSLEKGIWEDGRRNCGIIQAAVLFETMMDEKLGRNDTLIEGVLLAVLGIQVQHIFYTNSHSLIKELQIYLGQQRPRSPHL